MNDNPCRTKLWNQTEKGTGMSKCPKCEKENEDDWPLMIDGEPKDGGCQECWEAECDEAWWEYGEYLESIVGE